MAVVVGRLLALLEAQTAQFEARMDAASQQLNRMTSTTATARRGAMMLRSSMESLAFSGLGLLPPAAARAGAALTTLFVGSPVFLAILAVTAAVGALAMAFDHAGKKAAEMEEELRRVRDFQLGHTKMLASLGPSVARTPGEEFQDLLGGRAQAVLLQGRLRLLSMGISPATGGPLRTAPGIDPTTIAANATRNLEALTGAIRNFDLAIANTRRNFVGPFVLPGMNAPGVNQAGVQWANMQAAALGMRLRGTIPQIHAGREAVAPEGFQLTPQIAQMFLFSMMAMRGGGAGGAMMGLGGIAGSLAGMQGIAGHAAAGPLGWVGFGLSALGSLFTSNADKNAAKIVEAIERMAKEVGLERVMVIFTGPDGHQIRKTLAELEEGDAVERVPGPVGAAA